MTEQPGLHTADGTPIAFRGAEVTAHLAGLLAETTLTQHFVNDSDETLEVTYTFALPVDAVLLGFEVELGGQRLSGQVMPRAEAEERYEDAIETGHSAFRLTQLDDGLYVATLGNLQAGETAVLHVRHAETLRRVSGRLRYRLSTTIAPRYGTPSHIPAWQTPQSSLEASYAFRATVHLHGELARARFVCPSHRIGCEMAPDQLTLTLSDARMDRDFVLDLEPQGTTASALLAPPASEGDDFIALASFLPPARARSGAPRELVIVLDCSGSMAGDSIRHAREGVRAALASLQDDDSFALVRFGTRTETFRPQLCQADVRTLGAAQQWLAASDANLGGTEMARALELAMSMPGARATSGRDILLLTDGEAWNLDAIAERAHANDVRIFTVGIGSAVAEDTVRMLADETEGACELVTPDEAMPQRIAAHFTRMRQEPITEIELDWGQSAHWEVCPPHALFAGDAFIVHAALPAASEAVQALLHYADGNILVLNAPLQPANELADSVRRCAAAARLPDLPEEESSDWAVRHQLVSEYTDYLIVLERAAGEEADGLPTLQKTPQMLAAGWGGAGTVLMESDSGPPIKRTRNASAGIAAGMGIATPNPVAMVFDLIQDSISTLGEPLAWPEQALLEYLAHQYSRDPTLGLPTTINALVVAGLPDDLAKALHKLIAAGHAAESDIVWAYLLLIARDATPDSNATELLVPLAARTIPAKLLATVEEAIVEARGTAGALRQIRKNARRLFVDEPGKWLKRIRD